MTSGPACAGNRRCPARGRRGPRARGVRAPCGPSRSSWWSRPPARDRAPRSASSRSTMPGKGPRPIGAALRVVAPVLGDQRVDRLGRRPRRVHVAQRLADRSPAPPPPAGGSTADDMEAAAEGGADVVERVDERAIQVEHDRGHGVSLAIGSRESGRRRVGSRPSDRRAASRSSVRRSAPSGIGMRIASGIQHYSQQKRPLESGLFVCHALTLPRAGRGGRSDRSWWSAGRSGAAGPAS